MPVKRTDADAGGYRDGSILADAAYTLTEFKRRIGVKDAGIRRLRRAGLRVIYIPGGRAHVLGREWIRFLESQAQLASARVATEIPDAPQLG